MASLEDSVSVLELLELAVAALEKEALRVGRDIAIAFCRIDPNLLSLASEAERRSHRRRSHGRTKGYHHKWSGWKQ